MPLFGQVTRGQCRPDAQRLHPLAVQTSGCQQRTLQHQFTALLGLGQIRRDEDDAAVGMREPTGRSRRHIDCPAYDERREQSKPLQPCGFGSGHVTSSTPSASSPRARTMSGSSDRARTIAACTALRTGRPSAIKSAGQDQHSGGGRLTQR